MPKRCVLSTGSRRMTFENLLDTRPQVTTVALSRASSWVTFPCALLMVALQACAAPGAEGPPPANDPPGAVVVQPDLELPEPPNGIAPLETVAASDPANADRLIVGVRQIGLDSTGRRAWSVGYVSRDAGASWSRVTPIGPTANSGDNAVALGLGDTVYFAVLHYSLPIRLIFYRSNDGGDTWRDSTVLTSGAVVDRPYIVIDCGSSTSPRRIYAPFMAYAKRVGSKPRPADGFTALLFTSEDGGRTFTGPAEMPDNSGGSVAVGTSAVLSDGSVVMPLWTDGDSGRTIRVTRSRDAGRTLTSP